MSDFSVESSSTSSASDQLWLIWVFGKTHWSELMCKQVYCMLYLNIPTWIWPVTQHWYSSRQNRRPQTFTKRCRWKLWTIKLYKRGFKWWTRCCRLITKQHRCMYCINNSHESMHWYCCDYVFTWTICHVNSWWTKANMLIKEQHRESVAVFTRYKETCFVQTVQIVQWFKKLYIVQCHFKCELCLLYLSL